MTRTFTDTHKDIEIIRKLAAGQLVDQAILEIDPDEFETAYQWFLS
ncbi:MAG: hypothetical protein P8Y03_22740 [Anaerolineales bacterium]|jgi:hypothetical protein